MVSFSSFSDLDWLGCGFSTRMGGVSKGCFSSMNMSFNRGDNPVDVMENIRIFAEAAGFSPKDIVMPHQCHTTNVQVVSRNECGRGVRLSLLGKYKDESKEMQGSQCDAKDLLTREPGLLDIPGTEEEVDGQITNEPGVVLYVMGADCVPVFIVDTEKKIVSAVHAGWKGTVGDITKSAIEKMKSEFGCDTQNMRAVIGPSICQDCYEVSEDVAEAFVRKYINNQENKLSQFSKETVADSEPMSSKDAIGTSDMLQSIQHISENPTCGNPISSIVRPASGDFKDNPTGKFFLNLWEANRINLVNAGIFPENIEINGHCTKCHPDLFFSHRVHGDKRGVNVGYIFIKNQSEGRFSD